MRRLLIPSLAVTAASTLLACGSSTPVSTSPTTEWPTTSAPTTAGPSTTVPTTTVPGAPASPPIGHPGGDQPIIEVTEGPDGFTAPPGYALRLPSYRLHGNGTLIAVDPHEAPDDATGRVNVTTTSLSEDEVQRLLQLADAAALVGDHAPDYGQPGITDQSTTTVRVTTEAGTVRATAYALGTEHEAGGLSRSKTDVRLRLRALLRALDTAVRQAVPKGYRAGRWLVLADRATGTGPSDDAPDLQSRPWPLVDPVTGPPAAGGAVERCVIVTSDDLEPVLAAVEGTLDRPPTWQAVSGAYTLRFRPLLPGEDGCAALGS